MRKEEMRHCDVCNTDQIDHEVTVERRDDKTIWICQTCKHTRFCAEYEPLPNGHTHTTPETGYVVEDYPYGFRLRTSIRYWIETHPSRGDRFGSQTKNPKTGQWNKPKYSTYTDVGGLIREKANGHITWHGWGISYSYIESLNRFLSFFGESWQWNQHQLRQFNRGRAMYRTREHITMEIRQTEYRHKVTGEIVTTVPLMQINDYERVTDAEHDAEQQEVKKTIAKLHYMHLKQEGGL